MSERPIGWLVLTDHGNRTIYVDALAVMSVQATIDWPDGSIVVLRWGTARLNVREGVQDILDGVVLAQRASGYRNGI